MKVTSNMELEGAIILSWDFLATNWSTEPAEVAATSAGSVYSYTLNGITRYRFVPIPYIAVLDSFYSDYDLTTVIVSRG